MASQQLLTGEGEGNIADECYGAAFGERERRAIA